jgi:hypothetical protein
MVIFPLKRKSLCTQICPMHVQFKSYINDRVLFEIVSILIPQKKRIPLSLLFFNHEILFDFFLCRSCCPRPFYRSSS